MKIIVGIGNPGSRYAGTRHNVGFMAVDRLAERQGVAKWRKRFHSLAAEVAASSGQMLLMKPQTFMNESGLAVADAARWCRVELNDIMVVCDDFNLALGRMRVRRAGSSGGHNGLKSIFEHLGSEDVPRLRIGIGVADKSHDRDFVLSTFMAEERKAVDEVIDRAVDALEMWLVSGVENCMNTYNADPKNGSGSNKEEVEA